MRIYGCYSSSSRHAGRYIKTYFDEDNKTRWERRKIQMRYSRQKTLVDASLLPHGERGFRQRAPLPRDDDHDHRRHIFPTTPTIITSLPCHAVFRFFIVRSSRHHRFNHIVFFIAFLLLPPPIITIFTTTTSIITTTVSTTP